MRVTEKFSIPRIYLIFIIFIGIASFVFVLLISGIGRGDFWTYYYAGERALAGEVFVGPDTGMPTGPYVYLPITVLFYSAISLLAPEVAYVVLFCINLLGAAVVAFEVIRLCKSIGIKVKTTDKILITGSLVIAPPFVGNLLNAQPNYWLLAAIIAGYWLLENDRDILAGAAFSIPAIIKLWPALFGIWLLYHRSWKAIGSAIAIGTGALSLSVLVFGVELNVTYFSHILYERSWTDRFAGGIAPDVGIVSIRRPISTLLPSLDPNYTALLGILALSPVLWAYYKKSETQTEQLAAFGATVTIILLILPSIGPYFIFVLAFGIPLLYNLNYQKQNVAGIGLVLAVFTADAGNITAALDLLPFVGAPIAEIAWEILRFASIPLVGCLILLWSFYNTDHSSTSE